MIRRIIQIDDNKCNGCGACANACHEGAIGIINGKAKLLRDDYCDGLGDCLPTCPTGAITFVEREAAAYDEAAVKANMAKKAVAHSSGCPGSRLHQFNRSNSLGTSEDIQSQLRNWPVQLKLVPVSAPYFDNADLLIAADCTAYAYANFHSRFINNRITIIACPKLDMVDYADKLTDIIINNNIKSIKVVRMEVPCCAIDNAVQRAIQAAGRNVPFDIETVSIDGKLL